MRIDRIGKRSMFGTSTPIASSILLTVSINETIIAWLRCDCIWALLIASGCILFTWKRRNQNSRNTCTHCTHIHAHISFTKWKKQKITHNQLNFLYSLLLPLPLQLHFQREWCGAVWMCVCVSLLYVSLILRHAYARTHTRTWTLNTTHCTMIFVVLVAKSAAKKAHWNLKNDPLGSKKLFISDLKIHDSPTSSIRSSRLPKRTWLSLLFMQLHRSVVRLVHISMQTESELVLGILACAGRHGWCVWLVPFKKVHHTGMTRRLAKQLYGTMKPNKSTFHALWPIAR